MTDRPLVDNPEISRRDFLKVAAAGAGALAVSAFPGLRALAERDQGKDLLELKQKYLDYGAVLQTKINRGEKLPKLVGQEAMALSLFFHETAKKAKENGLELKDVAIVDWGTIAWAAAGAGAEIAGWTWSLIDKGKPRQEEVIDGSGKGDAERSRKQKFIDSIKGAEDWQKRLKIGGLVCLGVAGGRLYKKRSDLTEEIILEDTGPEGQMKRNAEASVLGYFDSPTGWQDLQAAANLSQAGETVMVTPEAYIQRNLYFMHKTVDRIYLLNQQLHKRVEKGENKDQVMAELISDSNSNLRDKFLSWSWAGQDLSKEAIIDLLIEDEELRRQFRAYIPNEKDNPFATGSK